VTVGEASFEQRDTGKAALSVSARVVVALGVIAALTLAALGAQSHPWTGGAEPGSLSTGWLGVVAALAVLAWLAILALVVFALWEGSRWLSIARRREPEPPYVVEPPVITRLEKAIAIALALVFVAGAVTAGVLVARSLGARSTGPAPPPGLTLPPAQETLPAGTTAEPANATRPNLSVIVGGAAALVVAAGAFAVVSRRRRPHLQPTEAGRDELVVTIDETLDDLRADPDARRAVIRAYARMERALSQHGLPRRSSEAPLEYLARVLDELGASSQSARRLTGLFAEAKFSLHPVGQSSKEAAVAALAALRHELEEHP
jgi:hypothetical protein